MKENYDETCFGNTKTFLDKHPHIDQEQLIDSVTAISLSIAGQGKISVFTSNIWSLFKKYNRFMAQTARQRSLHQCVYS